MSWEKKNLGDGRRGEGLKQPKIPSCFYMPTDSHLLALYQCIQAQRGQNKRTVVQL